MVKANELRIGNYVRIRDNILCVKSISDTLFLGNNKTSDFVHDDFNYEDVKPIELTSEILEKCGFERGIGSFSDSNMMLDITEHGYALFSGESTVGNSFKYLHELQNIYFALFGQEITYEN